VLSTATAYATGDHPTPFIFLSDDHGSATAVAVILIPPIAAIPPRFAPTLLVGSGAIVFAALTPILPAVITVTVRVANADLGPAILVDAELNLRLGQGRGGQEASTKTGHQKQDNFLHEKLLNPQ